MAAALAQEVRTQTIQPVVVTGTRTEKALADSPVKTELLTEEELQTRHYTDLSTAVKDLPGVSLIENTRRPGTAALIQGLGEEHVLVLIDGVPLPQSSSAGFDLSQISTKGIERVEVVKGASSALYGSHAMGGVINIITKEPADKPEIQFDVKQGYPEKGSQQENISGEISGKQSKIGYRINGAYRKQEGYDLDETSVAQDIDTSKKTNLGLYLERRWDDSNKVFTQYRYFNEDVHSVSSELIPMFGPQLRFNDSKLTANGIMLGGEKSLGGENRIKGFVSFDTTTDELIMADNPLTDFYEDFKTADFTNLISEVQWDQLYFGNHFFSTGLTYTLSGLNQENITTLTANNSVTIRDVDEKSYWSIAAFVQDDIIFDKWELVPGVRAEYDEDYGGKVSPKVSVLYQPNPSSNLNTRIRASLGTGYRVPNLKERFYYLDHTSVANYIVLGDENLKPEESISYQLGLELSYLDKSTFYLNGFYSEVTSLIQTVLVESTPALDTYRYSNVGKVDIYGVEARIVAKPVHWATVDASYTYTEATDRENGRILPYRPYSTARFATDLSLTKKINLVSIVNYRDDEFVDLENTGGKSKGYTTWDSKANFRVSPKASLYLGVDNILDEKRNPISDFQDPIDLRPRIGRFYYLGFSFNS